MDTTYLWIALIGLLAFFLKGITGTGTSTVLVSLSSLVIPAKWSVILAAFINVFGGFAMIKVDPVPLRKRYWLPIATTMIIGSVLGALTLKIIPNKAHLRISEIVFRRVMGVLLLVISVKLIWGSLS